MTTDTQAARPARVEHPSREDRAARGRAARGAVPRSAHAELPLPADRPDPVALLQRQAEGRVPELLPIRYGRMVASEFAFYRGAAAVMADDLSRTPSSGIRVQCCGDAHLSNFGVFASPERHLVFDLNDFDETLPGPWEWDVKRLAASFEIGARENGFAGADRRAVVMRAVRAYREAIRQMSGQTNLDVWYASLDVERLVADATARLPAKAIARAEKNITKARSRDSMQAFAKLTVREDGRRRFVSDPPLVVPVSELFPGRLERDELQEWIRLRLREYRQTLQADRRRLLEQYHFVDLARKVVGVGSVGTRCFIALMLGADESDPLMLQIKEATTSVLEPYLGRSVQRNAGHRVVAGQRLMQAASDIFLGWQRVEGADGVMRDYYWRQLRDWKGSAEILAMEVKAMEIYAQMCGWTLARAHARSGDRVAIGAYLGAAETFDRAIADFAAAYADQNARDHRALVDAVAAGTVEAQTGL
ncbi:MAG: DUF2252 domain-containing protein [Thermoleophilia bacterium]|jgi:uncharacterized protein (DUF2252 family)|nr:DUF2252 domain-containing protein [Thermoleophilia bacterium]